MTTEFWRDKTVLVTGQTGFKGSWLSLWLQKMGARVIGYSQAPPTQPSFFEDANVAEGMVSITGDVRELDPLIDTLEKHKPEVVFHLAAQSLVRHSYKHPLETYTTNVIGTANILEAVRQTQSVKGVLIVTSDKCYENKEWPWGYREFDPMGGYDPYSSSKGCAELVTAAYRRSYFSETSSPTSSVNIASARAGNVIGGGDWAADRLLPDIIRAILADREVHIRNPNAIRPWQFVLEPLCGYLRLAEKLWDNASSFSEAWNFGPEDNDCRPVDWIATEMGRFWGDKFRWVVDSDNHPHEANFLQLDCRKTKRVLGWAPKLDLTTALQWTNEWYFGFSRNEDVREVAVKQIEQYEDMLDE